MAYYILYDADMTSVALNYGIYDDIDKALEDKMKMAEAFADEILLEDPEVSGVYPEDRPKLIKDCLKSIAIQIIDTPINQNSIV
jgi:hypothetical protein